MPIFKKGNKRKKRNKTESRSGKIYMPQSKTSVNVSKRRKKKSLFKKSKSKNPRRKRRRKINISRILLYTLLPLIFFTLLYLSARFIIQMKGTGSDEDLPVEYVIGLEDIPTVPNSQFIFQNNIDSVSVANFIGSGNSAYRLPLNKTVPEAYEYYQEVLPDLGWEYILSVEVGSEEMKQGEYWVKDGNGLRVYSKFNDVWYETISEEQARTGLRDRVQSEVERDLLLASEDSQELLPDFPWVIEIPKEYVISYRTAQYEDLRLVEFKKIGSIESVTVTPMGAIGSVLDNYLRDYVEILNNQEGEDTELWTITNTILSYTSYASALKGTISAGSAVNDVAVVQNTYDNVAYVIHSNTTGSPFFEYVLTNMEPADTSND